MTTSISVIGCGRVGKTLCCLWQRTGIFEIRSVLNRSLESSKKAAEFAQGGQPIVRFSDLLPSDVFMISCSDDAIESCANELVRSGALRENNVVFHCSGAMPSAVLSAVRECGAVIGSGHPVKSFADPVLACQSFAGTYCGIEGDPAATQFLASAFHCIGGKVFVIDGSQKTIYHAGAVIASNYLVALLEAGLRCYEKAGIDRSAAIEILLPIVRGTIDNVAKLGTVHALTGPIARGEEGVVLRQYVAVREWDARLAEVYRSLGMVASELSEAQGGADRKALARIRQRLCESADPVLSD